MYFLSVRLQWGGVFSAGILHLFSPNTLREIAGEINRILEPNGGMFLEYRVNIKRTRLDPVTKRNTREPLTFGQEPLYKLNEAKSAIKEVFPGFEIEFRVGDEVRERFEEANPPYKFSCTNLLVMGIKK